MDQAGIIRDLLTWLEGHLDQPLSLDNVAAKAGYSKWHLQRMFKDVTGHAIGAYIRARRLSKSAVALRLTARPILDIALQYRFDSQQTFTRAFKKQFSQTRRYIAVLPEWSAFGIRPPMRLGEFAMPEHQFVTLEDTQLLGTTQSYSCSLEQISDFRHEMRVQFWQDFLSQAPTIPPLLYGLNETRPSLEKDDEQEVFYTTALPQETCQRVCAVSAACYPTRRRICDVHLRRFRNRGTGVYPDGIRHLYADAEPDPP
ncbi:right origin-binding protein [Citrobacter koseri]|uniref:Right origin-binding protein n=1 Tax=Citrobacter koseri TaxID=545 RepID=A0A2X2XI51_CITKO|nr:right origin-binding protein [Citrobacter koseri]